MTKEIQLFSKVRSGSRLDSPGSAALLKLMIKSKILSFQAATNILVDYTFARVARVILSVLLHPPDSVV